MGLFKKNHSVEPATTPGSGNWQVGDYYNANGKEGVVIWVDETGRFIKILHLEEAELPWCTRAMTEVATDAVDQHDGSKNLEAISKIQDWKYNFPAFAWCALRGEGWYLPASEELYGFIGKDSKEILEIVNSTLKKKGGKKIGGFVGGSYLSSTESEDRAKLLYSGSNVSDADKNYGHKVRAVAMIDTELSVCVEPAPAPAPVDAPVDAECPTIWKVGDYYNVNGKEGVVFWVDQTGKHGKIVSVDQSKLEWCLYDGYDDKTRRKSTDEDNGMKNLQEVMKLKDWQVNYCAHAWCADHGAGWYLPAVNELKELMQEDNMNKVNATLAQMNRELVAGRIAEADKYWSSTCGSKEKRFAWFVFAGGAYQFIMSMDFYVRAVAAF